MSLTFSRPRSWMPLVVLLLFLPAFLLDASPPSAASGRQWIGLGLYVVLIVAVAWLTFLAGTWKVEFDPQAGVVRVAWRNVLFLRERREYPLALFSAVRSYATPGRSPKTRVELLDTSRTRGLALASFPARSEARGFWSIPHYAEGEAARNLRLSVARATGLEDQGFLGTRWPGARLH